MSLATILLGTSLAFGAAGAPGVYNPDSQTCSGYVERTAPQIIAEYKLGERDFDCTEIPKVRGKRVSPFNTERNFARADLSGASFRGSEMPQTNWEGAQLEGADFEGADFEDYADTDKIADAIYKMYNMPQDEREKLGEKARCYAHSEFNHQKTIDLWHESLLEIVTLWKTSKPRRWELSEISI